MRPLFRRVPGLVDKEMAASLIFVAPLHLPSFHAVAQVFFWILGSNCALL